MAKRRIRLTTLVGTVSLATMGLAPLLIAGPASAAERVASASVIGNNGRHYQLDYDGGEGHDNNVALTLAESADQSAFIYTIDDVVTILAGENCVYPVPADHTKVSCSIENVPDHSSITSPTALIGMGSGNDTVTFTNLDGTKIGNSISLGEGANTYTSGDPSSYNGVYVNSQSGVDTFTLGTGDFIDSGAGNDVITLAGGAAEVHANAGNDVITGGAGDDKLYGGLGDDTVSGNDGNDYISGEQGNDTLYGGRGDDTIYGNSGDDVIYGNSGDDWLSGGPGTDTISGGTGTNTILD
jgi:Ca2+-binding RTX toxin-like protein